MPWRLISPAILALLPLCPAYAQPASSPPRARPAPSEIRAALQQVYATGNFDLTEETSENKIRAFLRNIWRRLRDAWRALFGHRFSQRLWETSPTLWFATVIGLLLVLALLIYHIVWTLKRVLRRRPPEGPPQPSAAEPVEPARLRREAVHLAARGEYRSAIRHLFLSALQSLHREGVLRLRPGQTNWEYAHELEQTPALLEGFAALAATVDRTWYGRQPATMQDYTRCELLLDRTLAAAQQP